MKARSVERWFKANARELPWRTIVRDPYRSLVSEVMLQQTQVSRVLDRFGPFLARFPTVQGLAAAPERAVLAEWSGMGYYRRARNLHAAAKEIVTRFGGRVPDQVRDLQTLPGIGRYTAGAIASLVFGKREPIVDGNVARVLMRVEGKQLSPTQVWSRAEALVKRAAEPGVFNEGLMELGAVICLPRGARCSGCPLKGQCRARAMNRVDEFPRPKPQARKQRLFCASVILVDARGRFLVERRSDEGMWAGLWQAPTLEGRKRAVRRVIEEWIGVTGLTRVDRFDHGTTHREVEFEVWRGQAHPAAAANGRSFRSPGQIRRLGLSNAQRRILSAPR